MNKKKLTFTHCSIEGTPYQAGRQLGEMFKESSDFIQMLTSPFLYSKKLTKRQINKVMTLYDHYCPGTNEEIKGFADAIGVSSDDIVYYFAYLQSMGNCCHIAFIPSITSNEHIYLGRNYDYDWNDKPILITSSIEGQHSQIGFACQLFGRFDGMNEHGLCITTSSGVIQPTFSEEGFVFPVIVRSLLNRCKNVKEALEMINTMPIADYRNFIIIDAFGESALVEVAGSKMSTKHIEQCSIDNYLFSTNHYNTPTMKKLNFPKVKHSITRYESIESSIKSLCGQMTKSTLKSLLSTPMPEGVCCHHYKNGMGTIWSMIFDSIEKKVDICFGSPNINPWREFNINYPIGVKHFSAELPDEPVESGFWDKYE